MKNVTIALLFCLFGVICSAQRVSRSDSMLYRSVFCDSIYFDVDYETAVDLYKTICILDTGFSDSWLYSRPTDSWPSISGRSWNPYSGEYYRTTGITSIKWPDQSINRKDIIKTKKDSLRSLSPRKRISYYANFCMKNYMLRIVSPRQKKNGQNA